MASESDNVNSENEHYSNTVKQYDSKTVNAKHNSIILRQYTSKTVSNNKAVIDYCNIIDPKYDTNFLHTPKHGVTIVRLDRYLGPTLEHNKKKGCSYALHTFEAFLLRVSGKPVYGRGTYGILQLTKSQYNTVIDACLSKTGDTIVEGFYLILWVYGHPRWHKCCAVLYRDPVLCEEFLRELDDIEIINEVPELKERYEVSKERRERRNKKVGYF